MPPLSCEHIARTLRSTGANAASYDEKLRLANLLVKAGADCIFPDRFRFVLEWLCGALKAKGGSGRAPPRTDVRFWRLLDALLHRPLGLEEPDDDGCTPPTWPQASQLAEGLRTRIGQAGRMLLQAAAAAFEHGCAPPAADTDAAAPAAGQLCARARRTMSQLLVEDHWFRPGPEATAEYATSVCARAVGLLDAPAGTGAAAAEEPVLLACADALKAVVALQDGGEAQPRKVLQLYSGALLRAVLALHGACVQRRAALELAHDGPPPPPSLRAALELVERAVSESAQTVLMYPDHLSEYGSTLHRLATSAAVGGAADGDARGKKRSRGAPAAGASNYTAPVLEAITQLRREDASTARARSVQAARAAAQNGAADGEVAARALVIPVQPLLLEWFRAVHRQQQEALHADRRMRAGLQSRRKAAAAAAGGGDGGDGEPATASANADFAFFSWLMTPQLAAIEATLAEAEAALAPGASSIGQAAAAALFEASEAAAALAALVRATGACGVYRPREDTTGEHRSLLDAALVPTARLARALASSSAEAAAHAATRAAHSAVCDCFEALLTLDALVVRPRLPEAIALLAATATSDGLRAPAPAALLVSVVRTAAAERQLALLLQTLAAQAVDASAAGHVGLGTLMACAPLWQRLSDAVAACPEAQGPELCDGTLAALEAHAAATATDVRSNTVTWQLSCVLGAVFDAIPVGAHTAASLQAAAHRGIALAQALAAATGAEHRAAASMLLWRASAALGRATADALTPGTWGEMLDASLPAPLQLAHATLGSSDSDGGEREAGAAAARLAALHAVAYAAEWAHVEIATLGACPEEEAATDGKEAEGASKAGGDSGRLRKRQRQRMRLLTGWDSSAGRRAAQRAQCGSRIPACTTASGVFASHWSLLCEHAALIDEYAPSAQLRRWFAVLWHSVCEGEGDGEDDGVDDATRMSVQSASRRLLTSAGLYELPRVRGALLPSAWRWLQKRLPAPSEMEDARGRGCLVFVLRPVDGEAPGDGDDDGDGDDGDGDDDEAAEGDDHRAWGRLVGCSISGRGLSAHVWRPAARLLGLLGRLSHEWMPSEQVGWLLPRVLIMAQLAQSGLRRGTKQGDGTQLCALAASLRLAAALASSCPAAASSSVRSKALRRVLRWSVKLPQALLALRLSSADRRSVETACAALVQALSAAALASAPPVGDAETPVLLQSKCWSRWLGDEVRPALSVPATEDHAPAAHSAGLAGLAAHLAALADAVPPPPPRRWTSKPPGVDGADEASESEDLEAVAAAEAAAAVARRGAAWLGQVCDVLAVGGSAAVPPFELLTSANEEPSEESNGVLSGVLEALAMWLRCYGAMSEHGATPPPPPRLDAAVRCSVRVLSEATPSSEASAASEARLRDAALALLDALSEAPAAMQAALPLAERRELLQLLRRLIEPLARYAELTPSGRPRALDAHTPLGMLRRLLTATDEDDTYGWALDTWLAELNPDSDPVQLRASLLSIGLACLTSAPQQRATLSARSEEVLHGFTEVVMSYAPMIESLSEADTVRTATLQAITALATNDHLRFTPADVGTMLIIAGSISSRLELRAAPAPGALPSAPAFNAAYFLVTTLLRQRARLVHSVVPLLLAVVRGLLYALAHGAPGAVIAGTAESGGARPTLECARNLRRLLESLAPHKKVIVRHCSYLLADVVAVWRERPLPAAGQRELLPGVHALLGMCTEVEVQAVHAASDPGRQQVLKSLLESYEQSFKYRGKV